ncbi:helix-turn-helix domain-containing protein [Acinetobacter johnsonii]|jgi:Zn-dependent peptidase ImmA (M78 family)/DNA-binding XRE family transcriptional regulator|uniref:helix-turn-helix domain-containing protein n=1 Tax=Acinetobacter johnsonii TaxID=40214 RepID=UPI00244D5DAA|nr:XRE family transcriptional regulator [Acinetobacter johnsonii]MDH0710960.1 XRE family transcriptional regulator [Acinetobacter johnsonii]
MFQSFNGLELKLLRLFNEYSLEDVAEKIGKSKQYIHKLETGLSYPTDELLIELCKLFEVKKDFFYQVHSPLQEDQIHFRSLKTSRQFAKQVVIARAEQLNRLLKFIEEQVNLPDYLINSIDIDHTVLNGDQIEKIADDFRKQFDLGLAPISNLTEFCEDIGIIVTDFDSISTEVDALSLICQRPIIVRNTSKKSVCRQRFDIAHEVGHMVLHNGVITGDNLTESQAHRFASSLLLPQAMLRTNFPILFKGGRFDWAKMSEFKQIWGISKAAILYRAKQLNLLDDNQYKTGIIHLRVNGEAKQETEDMFMPYEIPTLLKDAVYLIMEDGFTVEKISEALNISKTILEKLTDMRFQSSKVNLKIV